MLRAEKEGALRKRPQLRAAGEAATPARRRDESCFLCGFQQGPWRPSPTAGGRDSRAARDPPTAADSPSKAGARLVSNTVLKRRANVS